MHQLSLGQCTATLCGVLLCTQYLFAQAPVGYPPVSGGYPQSSSGPNVPAQYAAPPPSGLADRAGQPPTANQQLSIPRQGLPGYENAPAPPTNPNGGDGLASGSAGQGLVLGVEVVGNEFVPSSRIQQELRTRKDREFDQTVVQADVRRLLRTDLFYNVKTFTTPGPGGVVVRFQVFERPLVRDIQFVGNWHIMDKSLNKHVTIETGKPLNTFAVDDGRRRIEEFYRTKGFPKATVSILEGNKPGDANVIYVINEGHLERISQVNFVGNDPKVVSGRRLKTFIQSKPGIMWYFLRGKVDREKIDQDVERITAYYRSLGFFRARVGRELTYDQSNKWLDLTFVINEGPRYVIRDVMIAGNDKFTSDSLLGHLQLKPGEYFNLPKMNRDVNALTDIYGEHGHVYVDVQADPRFLEEPGQLDLIYQVDEGDPFSVGKIHVHIGGEYPHTRRSVVYNRMAGIYPGDIFNRKSFDQAKRRITQSQLFANNPAEGKEPKLVIQQPKISDIAKREAKEKQAKQGSNYRGQSPAATMSPRNGTPVQPPNTYR